ncbi:MAG: hypothetical protein A2015_08320 [Spirochaetes bacterium GWF1_31_7]|nr:MAG: hypothetical protein A2Y30_08515 [Spirochaetes bacterium GWE1_32_154]OHD47153.1 MAG: hypothetical protein A2015_08320 [Spirochaetes bacterium GWF1_31_7]OHD47462.1 MAG: hypothetical protein A2Y29_08740 [Spirochaetes bacterium GWE2_31_10]OHD81821.1 MAG: hypothetical protein A2355_02555 [Spirochaetes bacterium RIFOXYB1_FULL_32_8]
MDSDSIVFAPEDTNDEACLATQECWKVLIVDDEPEMHTLTKRVLSGFRFLDRRLHFMSAYSGIEAKQIMAGHNDIAVIFLDVVMEEEEAGLKVVKYIRDELKNNFVRIILRTGQPGSAPEEKIIVEYDINDYKEKTELTMRKLFTTLVTALRSYKDIVTIYKYKLGLEKIIKASANIFEIQSLKLFTTGVLIQLTSIVNFCGETTDIRNSAFAIKNTNGTFFVMGATGKYADAINMSLESVVPHNVFQLITQAFNEKKSIYTKNGYIAYLTNKNKSENIIYLEGCNDILSDMDKELINLFCLNVSIAFDNLTS